MRKAIIELLIYSGAALALLGATVAVGFHYLGWSGYLLGVVLTFVLWCGVLPWLARCVHRSATAKWGHDRGLTLKQFKSVSAFTNYSGEIFESPSVYEALFDGPDGSVSKWVTVISTLGFWRIRIELREIHQGSDMTGPRAASPDAHD